MNDKTESLRDIFMDVADDQTVTERQEESPGTLTEDRPIDERLQELVDEMRDRYAFSTDLDTDQLLEVARGFYDGHPDEGIADGLEISPDTVFRARLDLHLIDTEEQEGPVPTERVRDAIANDESVDEVTRELNADEDALARQFAVARTAARMRQASYRFRDEFDELLGDADLADHMPEDAGDDGLEEATEGLEVETGF